MNQIEQAQKRINVKFNRILEEEKAVKDAIQNALALKNNGALRYWKDQMNLVLKKKNEFLLGTSLNA